MSKLIVVVGATGNQGSSVAKTFSKLSGWNVRGITRNPDGPSAKPLRDLGIELVAGDLDAPESLVRAFSGAHAIFGVTDFWQFMTDPTTSAAAEKRGIAPNIVCLERELQQFKNIIDAAAHVLANENKMERLVLSTLSYSSKLSKGEIAHNYHFDGKAMGVEYLQNSTAPELVALAKISSYVQIGFYLDNWKNGFGFGPARLEDGRIVYQAVEVSTPIDAFPAVHPPTDTGPFVEALVLRNPPGTTMLGTSQFISRFDFADMLSRHLGHPVTMHYLHKEYYLETLGPHFGLELFESNEYVAKFGWDGGADWVKKPWELGVKMDELTTPEQYIRETDWSSLTTA